MTPHESATLAALGLRPGSAFTPAPSGRQLRDDVAAALVRLGIKATLHRRGPYLVDVEIAPGWPDRWQLADVPPRTMQVSGRTVRRLPS